VVDRPALLLLVLDQHVLAVEEEDVELCFKLLKNTAKAAENLDFAPKTWSQPGFLD
jgi:hypothetical protein